MTETYRQPGLSIGQQHALLTAARTLAREFAGVSGTETIDTSGLAAIAWSGGSEPGRQVNPAAIAAMRERGIDISAEFPKPWTDEVLRAADAVISMGCGDACQVFPGKRYEDWALDDPDGLDLAAVRPSGTRLSSASATYSPNLA